MLSVELTGSVTSPRRSAIAAATSFIWERPRSRRSFRCSRRPNRARAAPARSALSRPSRSSRYTASRSCCEKKARPQRWAAAGSFSHRPGGCGAATRRRSHRLGRFARRPDSSACARALAFLGLGSWTERRLVALTGLASREIESRPCSARRRQALSSIFPSVRGGPSACWPSSPSSSKSGPCVPWAGCTRARPRHSAIPRAQLAAAFPDLANDSPRRRPDRTAQGAGQSDRRSATVALRGFSAQAQPGRTEAQGRAGRNDSSGRDQPSRRGRLAAAAGPRGRLSPTCSPCCDEEQIVEINANSISTSRPKPSCADASGSALPTAPRSPWQSCATCWARPANTPSRSANTSTASA